VAHIRFEWQFVEVIAVDVIAVEWPFVELLGN
jgi:hypothetical protein